MIVYSYLSFTPGGKGILQEDFLEELWLHASNVVVDFTYSDFNDEVGPVSFNKHLNSRYIYMFIYIYVYITSE